MGKTDIKKFYINKKKYFFDCKFNDINLIEDSFSFNQSSKQAFYFLPRIIFCNERVLFEPFYI